MKRVPGRWPSHPEEAQHGQKQLSSSLCRSIHQCCEMPLEQITALRQLLATMKDEEITLCSSLGIFKMGRPTSKDLQKLEKGALQAPDYLQHVWEITEEREDSGTSGRQEDSKPHVTRLVLVGPN
ncbi:unnamed protein product [Lepidochelys olivacea]